MSYVHFLPAQHGDSIIISCNKGENTGIIVVDGGPCSNPRLNYFVKAVEELGVIDLIVLTHHDSDHITGILQYFKRHLKDVSLPIKNIWANCADHIDFETSENISARQANKLANILDHLKDEKKASWRSDIHDQLPIFNFPFASIEILGPSIDTFRRFQERYEEKVFNSGTSPIACNNANTDIDIHCKELAKRPKITPNPAKYQTLTNMASISFIIRCDGLSIMMLADSFPQEIVECLVNKGYSKENKLKVDYIKIAHHGSQHNTSNDLLDLVDCENYLISTNGGSGQSRHPQRETLANILCHPERDYSRTVNLYFNYPLSTIQRYGNQLFNEALDKDLNYRIYEPDTDASIKTGYRISFS